MSVTRPRTIRIATRSSRLALWQAEHVAGLVRAAAPAAAVELVRVATTGDRDLTGDLRSFGGLGVFTREVQKAVLERSADLAVHSLKDLPTEPAAGLCLAAVPEREETADVLVRARSAAPIADLAELRQGAHVGTGSLRRRAQLLFNRPDLRFSEARGNVETRLRKLDEGEFDALVLAKAGLVRLGLADRISLTLIPPLVYPAVGQGALGIECRDDDADLRGLLAPIEDAQARRRVDAERALLAHLRAGCHAPVGAATWFEDADLVLEAVVCSPDGQERLVAGDQRAPADPHVLGRDVAERLLKQGADRLIRAVR